MQSDGRVVCWGDGETLVPRGINVLGTQSQSITFTSTPPASAIVGGTYAVAATGGYSGSPVTFSSLTSSICSVSAGNVTFLNGGTCTIAANQAAFGDYSAAPQVTQSFNVNALLPISASVGAGDFHTCALRPAGTVACWGLNDFGQAVDQSGPYVEVSAAAPPKRSPALSPRPI